MPDTKIKICGLFRPSDIDAVNKAQVDYAGFIVNYPKSHRSIGTYELKDLTEILDRKKIKAVGVFVNKNLGEVINLLNDKIIDIAQLHGSESNEYISQIKNATNAPVIKAFIIDKDNPEKTLDEAYNSLADFVLLDSGMGSGVSFDYGILKGFDKKYFLAGGINAENVMSAIDTLFPYAVDISTGVERDKCKDRQKILDIVKIIRKKG